METGSPVYDQWFNEGYPPGMITCFYGPGGSGKTLSCMLAAIATVAAGKKVIFIDTEQNFSVERMNQLTSNKKVLDNILVFNPKTFEDLGATIDQLAKMVSSKFGLVIVDSLSVYYRLAIARKESFPDLNNAFVAQTEKLSMLAKEKEIPVIITSQVYESMEKGVQLIGGFILKNRCKVIIELEKLHGNKRRAILHRINGDATMQEQVFSIVKEGMVSGKAPS